MGGTRHHSCDTRHKSMLLFASRHDPSAPILAVPEPCEALFWKTAPAEWGGSEPELGSDPTCKVSTDKVSPLKTSQDLVQLKMTR